MAHGVDQHAKAFDGADTKQDEIAGLAENDFVSRLEVLCRQDGVTHIARLAGLSRQGPHHGRVE